MIFRKSLPLFLLLASTAVIAEPTVTGNNISWPDDGWYQVQAVTDDGIIELCAGTRFCEVPDGNYIVINHTTGERFENVVVDSEPAVSEVTVSGNTISWPDDGWYQVQSFTDEGIVELCAGTRLCEVPDGSYVVINHTTGVRYEDVVVGDTSGPVASEVTVTGNTISWPNDGWYQVQAVTEDGQVEICAGTQFCEVPDGDYIVINHTTGERFEDIVVANESVMSDITVSGNTISWPDNGWYQVQTIGDDGLIEVCAGTRFCEVPDGDYIVINHTTGERFEPVVVNSGSTEPDPEPMATIRAETWNDILRNVVALINADRAIERHEMILDRFSSLSRAIIAETIDGDTSGTLAALGLTQLPLADPDNPSALDFSCSSGGTLAVTITGGVPVYAATADNCLIGDDLYDGGFNHNGVGREGFRSQMDSITVSLPDSTQYALAGNHSTFFDRVGIRRSIQWTGANLTEQTMSDNYSVEGFTMQSEAANGIFPGQGMPVQVSFEDGTSVSGSTYTRFAAVTGSFAVTAPWSDNQAMQITSDLTVGGTILATESTLDLPIPYETTTGTVVWPLDDLSALPSQWTSGSVDIVAADGSSMSLRPMIDDNTRAVVVVDGISEPQEILWNDGYQVRCFGEPAEFPNCQ